MNDSFRPLHYPLPTHASGHALDVTSTRNQCRFIEEVKVVDPLDSDHCAFFGLLLHKSQLQRKTIGYRKLRLIDYEELKILLEAPSYLMKHVLILIRCLIHIILF